MHHRQTEKRSQQRSVYYVTLAKMHRFVWHQKKFDTSSHTYVMHSTVMNTGTNKLALAIHNTGIKTKKLALYKDNNEQQRNINISLSDSVFALVYTFTQPVVVHRKLTAPQWPGHYHVEAVH